MKYYENQAAVEFHNETLHFQNFLDHINDYLTSAPEITRMDY